MPVPFELNPGGTTDQAAANAAASAKGQVVSAGLPSSVVAAITNGQSLSAAVEVQGKLVGLIVPAAWTAAGLSFQGSIDGTNFFDIYDDGVERQIASANVAINRLLSLDLNDWLPVQWIKVRSGTAAVPVAQGALRNIVLIKAG